MSEKISFLDALQVDNVFNPQKQSAGVLTVKGSAEQDAIETYLREVAANRGNPEVLRAFGANVMEPIRTLARYRAYTAPFFVPVSYAPGEENSIPVWSPLGAAFVTSPEGRPQYISPGAQTYTFPGWTEIEGALMVRWSDLAVAKWNILQRMLEETADDMAHKLDSIAIALIDAAITALGGSHAGTATTNFTKAEFDAILIAAEQTGFPVTQVIVNPSRITDMSKWTNGTTSALPTYFAPQSAAESVYKQLWFNGYGNLRYFLSHNVPMSKVYFAGDAPQIGYHQTQGALKSVSDMDIDNKADKHIMWEYDAWYIGNSYNLWSITVS